ncbi:Vps20-associated 1 [Guillardia theta CCMP2712]|uniref:Vps20-associated 1 n=2 Tax=Guillardia theta TaxID=55529 RepID=L1K3G3_GUITC|nr:Vps20-associated 1 [Guillardia theta CCMP2712]EKX55005.1 Vps20-associated 1 [Guillardia theta CCMP2712]|eukprot:XP_005841985.1 Vps20-associated 1 [Guillardia theta CCMP2712]
MSGVKRAEEILARADKLDKSCPVVAMHCRIYALELAIKGRDKNNKEQAAFLAELMTKVEQQKASLGHVPDAQAQCELLALSTFQQSDDQYYEGRASKATVVGFRNAAILMEICKQFGELSPDIAEKYKYAKVKAVEIYKAIQEGVVPLPPQLIGAQDGDGHAEEEEDDGIPLPPPSEYPPQDHDPNSDQGPHAQNSVVEDIPDVPPPYRQQDDFVKPPAPSVKPEPAKPKKDLEVRKASPMPSENRRDSGADAVPGVPNLLADAPKAAPPPRSTQVSGNLVPKQAISPRSLDKAEKHTKFALSAIQFDDIREAVSNLQIALSLLTDK